VIGELVLRAITAAYSHLQAGALVIDRSGKTSDTITADLRREMVSG
jgi:hypothetical protein